MVKPGQHIDQTAYSGWAGSEHTDRQSACGAAGRHPEHAQTNIVIFALLLLGEIGVTIYFSRLASKPLNQLSDEAKKLRTSTFTAK
jgi:hypothetical protein